MKTVICEKKYHRVIIASTYRRSVAWLLRNLSLDGELCLGDGKNAEFCSISSPSLTVAGNHGKRHTVRAHEPQAVSDWLNPYSLGTISAFGSIANVAYN